jgi:hypothetical protein
MREESEMSMLVTWQIYSASKPSVGMAGNSLSQLYEFANAIQCSVALPYKIGCDRGGGDWNVVLGMINDIFTDVDIKLYKLE